MREERPAAHGNPKRRFVGFAFLSSPAAGEGCRDFAGLERLMGGLVGPGEEERIGEKSGWLLGLAEDVRQVLNDRLFFSIASSRALTTESLSTGALSLSSDSRR